MSKRFESGFRQELMWSPDFGQVVKLGSPAKNGPGMTGKRTQYSADFKAKVALEALQGELTPALLASKHGIHQTMAGEWKRRAMEGLTAVFSGKSAAQDSAKAAEADVEKLHAKIGQLVVERDFLARSPVDKLRSAALDDRAGASAAVDRAAV